MSIKSISGNVGSYLNNTAETGLAYGRNLLNNVTNTVSTSLGNIWSGGFAGISQTEVEGTLIPAIEKYCETIEGQISSFNAEGDLSQTFAGEKMQAAAGDYVSAIKELLQAYVSTMRQEIARVRQAYEAWNSGTASVASNASSNASEIRSAANSIKLD